MLSFSEVKTLQDEDYDEESSGIIPALSFRENMQKLPTNNIGAPKVMKVRDVSFQLTLQNLTFFLSGSDSIQIREKEVKVHTLLNGNRVARQVTSGSHYYCFDIDENDKGIMLVLSQEPSGDRHNFVQLLLNFGALPNAVDRTHVLHTRKCKHVFLDLHSADLRTGTWYMKVTGFGSTIKTFAFDFRINTKVGLKNARG